MSKDAPLSYRLGPWDPKHGDMRQTAFTQCATCPTVGKIPIVHLGNNPEKIAKLYIRGEWDYDVHNPRRCFCPKCTKQRAIKAGEEVERMQKAPAPGLKEAQRIQVLSPPKVIDMRNEIGIKALNPQQKADLRRELDSTFDDSVGRYLDGNSDHKISEKLGIPRIVVEEFRENFYGELQDDPEIRAFRQQLDDAKRVLGNLQSSINKMELKLDEIARKVGL